MMNDNERVPSDPAFSEAGIVEFERARKNWLVLERVFGDVVGRSATAILNALSRAADPDLAMNNLERFAAGLSDPAPWRTLLSGRGELLSALTIVLGASRFLASVLFSEGDAVLGEITDSSYLLRTAGKTTLTDRCSAALAGATTEREAQAALRRFRKREMLRIGMRDLLGRAELQETVGELSDLAEVCLQAACEWVEREVRSRFGRPLAERDDGTKAPAGFAVIAMGKLGGRELNFSSDIDLMYVYGLDGETEGVAGAAGDVTGKITNHEYFIKLAEKLTAMISQKTEEGFVFRVDLRLRPEGQRGPLVQSLGGYEIYYESWGQAWERAALIKARFVAGDAVVGEEFIDRITPFVYRKYLDFGALDEIRAMKQKINREVEQKGRALKDVKLGYGGIREIEFLVQALQLIYGGRDRGMRERGTLKSLHLISQRGLISYQEQAELSEAYVFLRNIEHRIQIVDDLQTQTIPSDGKELRSLARRLGYLATGREAEQFLIDYRRATGSVRRIYDDLFTSPAREERSRTDERGYTLLFDAQTAESDAQPVLKRAGFSDPGKAFRNLVLLREGPAFVHQTPRGRRLFSEVFPRLFDRIVASPDPDMALHHLETFLSAQGSWDSFQARLRQDTLAEQTLIAIFANSEYFSRMLVANPGLLDDLVDTSRASGLSAKSSQERELGELVGRAATLAEKLDALRQFKQREEIRIGMADLLAVIPQSVVWRHLSRLAEAVLGTAFDLATSEVFRRLGIAPFRPRLAIIGAGKLGGRELTYGSDLDIMFVSAGETTEFVTPGITVGELYSKIAEKTISYLTTMTRFGHAYRVDSRLRPTGSKGPLVQSLSAFRSYYAAQAETWELQSLTNARFVAGDRVAGEALVRLLEGLIYRTGDLRALAHDVIAMRRRMEQEMGKEDDHQYNIKQGRGGIVDIDFLVQFLQLGFGHEHPRIRIPGTFNGLRAARKTRLLSPADLRMLREAYGFLRLLESRLRIVTNQATTMLSRDPVALRSLARRMGYSSEVAETGQSLLRDYEGLTGRVREVFLRVTEGVTASASPMPEPMPEKS